MEIKIRNYKEVQRFLEGGEMAPPTEDPNAAPAEPAAELGDPLLLIVLAAAQAVQTLDAQLAMQVCLALVQIAGGGAEGAPQAPEGQEPVYGKGGSLRYWKRK